MVARKQSATGMENVVVTWIRSIQIYLHVVIVNSMLQPLANQL
jgi:hypothetical protein